MKNIYSVIFNNSLKSYYFYSDIEIDNNTKVIVETENGEQLGKVVDKCLKKDVLPTKKIIRVATSKDYDIYLDNLKQAEKALKKCSEIKDELGLEMKVISSSFTFDKKQLLITFIADDRVDFRVLAKRLAYIYKTRIELRQIGARDKAKEVSGLGICGQKLCCSNFLNQMESVSINMAKNQNLALNPTKINGSCNRLLCCLAYEDENYSLSREKMPYIGQKIKTKKGEGTVKSLNLLKEECLCSVGDELITVSYKNNEHSKK